MIISKTPLRITLGGGGTDIPSYFKKNGGGFLVASSIDKHIYISVNRNFSDNLLLKYSKIENVKNIDEVEHPILRECLKMTGIQKELEISSMADIPAGTGLGSSGAFTVGLLNALHSYTGNTWRDEDLAKQACKIEIDILKEPIGMQDQYIAALGGLKAFEFYPDGRVVASKLRMNSNELTHFETNLVLFYTGMRRSASEELSALDKNISLSSEKVISNINQIKENGLKSFNALENCDFDKYAQLMTRQWLLKLERSPTAVNLRIHKLIELGIAAGASGGKLIGAGGGGFLLFYAERKEKLKSVMSKLNLPEISFKFDEIGSRIIN